MVATATICILAMVAGCGSTKVSGVTDTKADKGLSIIGEGVTYDPNHLVNDGKPIQLEYWSWNGSKGSDPVIDMIEPYTKIHPNVTIKTVNVSWEDYWTKLPLVLQGKNGPAIFNIHNSYDALIRPYAADYDVDVKALEDAYTTASVHVADGKVKYIDSVINTGNIYYNKTLWKEAGLTDGDIPKTWDEFRDVAKKLAKWDGGKMVQAGFNFNGAAYSAIYEGLNYQKGQVLFSDDGKKPDYDNKVTAENMQFLKDLYDKDKVGATDFGNDYTQSFGNGQSAMIYAWGWLDATMKEKYPDVDYGVFATPTPSTATPFAYDRYNGESTPGINSHSSKEQQAVAQDFVKYLLANDDYIRAAVKEMNSFPAKKSLQNDKEILSQPVMAAIKPRIERLIWPGSMPSTMETSATTAFENVFHNGKSIDESLAEAQKQMETDMKNSDFVSAESKYAFYDERS